MASTIYIAPTGNDTTGTGTTGAPYLTLTKAITAATAGDTVFARMVLMIILTDIHSLTKILL